MITTDLLLCIDAQPVFLREMKEVDSLTKRIALAISSARGLELPILFTEQVPHKLGGTDPQLLKLAPDAPVHAKDAFSIFGDASISDAIQARSPQRLLLCGLETPVCIYQSALDALSAGHRVTILSDAVGARRPDDAWECLESLRIKGAEVLPTETVFYALLKSVQHPFFKDYTRLVKAHG